MSALPKLGWIVLQLAPAAAFFLLSLFSDWAREHLTVVLPLWLVAQLATILASNWPSLETWRAHRAARARLTNYSRAVLEEIVHLIPGIAEPIPRQEADKIAKLLKLGQRVLLVGEAGTGKTGILRELASRLPDRPVILLDARDFADCRSFEDMGRRLSLPAVDIVECVRRWARSRRAVLVLDQCDSIMHTDARNLLLDFVMNCSEESRLGIVLVARPHESKGMTELLKIKSDCLTCAVESQPLSTDEASAMLHRIGVKSPPAAVVELARNLLELSMIGDLVETEGLSSLGEIEGELGLWERYRTSLATRESATRAADETVINRAIDLATECLRHPRATCELSSPLTREDGRLVSRQVLVRDVNVGERYRFRHESFRNYLFAWDAAKRKQWSLADIKNAIGAGQAGVVSDWIVRLYAAMDESLAASFLAEMLND
jgi:hypothetical protein